MVNSEMTEIVLRASSNEWCQFQAKSVVPLQQSLEYGQVCKALGREVVRLKVLNGTYTVYTQFIVGSMLGRRRFAHNFRGPVLFDEKEDHAAKKKAYWRALDLATLGAMIATPNSTGDLMGIPMMTGATVAEVDLEECQRLQRAKMKSKWRNQLVRVENSRGQVEVAPATEELIAHLSELDQHQQKVRRYKNLPPQFLKHWARHYPEQTHIFVQRDSEGIVASMVFLRHGASATYHLGWRRGTASSSGHNLLLWHAMRFLVEQSVRRLDLGQIDTVNTPGLARFKLGVGARARQLGKTYWIN